MNAFADFSIMIGREINAISAKKVVVTLQLNLCDVIRIDMALLVIFRFDTGPNDKSFVYRLYVESSSLEK